MEKPAEFNEEDLEKLNQLLDSLLTFDPLGLEVTPPTHIGVSLIQLVKDLDGILEADKSMSQKSKKAIKSLLEDALAVDTSGEVVDESSSTTTNPQIQSQPGHSDGDPH